MKIIVALAMSLISLPCLAGDNDYRPGGQAFADAWHQFYDLGDHEPELDDPLIRRGSPMVPAICTAVAHKDMKYRRYALGALGYIRDPGALACLEPILKDTTELEYFRGDALLAIYSINPRLGAHYIAQYGNENSHLRMIAELISKDALPIGTTGLEHE
jgi:hypothetical protein